jgi:hypothetical protein
VIGTFLYYGRAVDSTMLTALSAIASAQAEPTEETMTCCKQFLDYAATHQDAILTYKASDMVLVVHSDVSYLSKPKARSRVGGHFFLSSDCEDQANNGAVLNLAKLFKAVMSSVAEAALGAFYINAREAVPQRTTLAEMGHQQPQTPMQTNNTTALGVVNNNIQLQCTKVMDMRFHWLRDCKAQRQFLFFWQPGPTNRTDYCTKHHCAAHHIEKHPKILTPKIVLEALRASVKRTPNFQQLALPNTKPSKICTSSSGSIKSTTTLQEVLKGCVRSPLAIYLRRNMEFSLRINTSMYFWHKAQYCEIGCKSKFATTLLRHMCVMLRLGAQVSRELIILCTNLTVRLI